jgi:hypothetical protein
MVYNKNMILFESPCSHRRLNTMMVYGIGSEENTCDVNQVYMKWTHWQGTPHECESPWL